MRLRIPILTTAALCVAIAAGCSHSGGSTSSNGRDPAVQAAIQAAYDRQSAGYVARDPNAVMAQCAPNYTEVNGQETDSRRQVAQTIADFIALAYTLKASATVQSVDVDGQTAHVVVDRHFDLLSLPLKKKSDPGPRRHRFVSDETNQDTWTFEDGKHWLKLGSVTVKSASTLDGAPAN